MLHDDVKLYANTLTIEELDKWISSLSEVRDRKKNEERKTDWQAVKDAIDNYVLKWGGVKVRDIDCTLTIDAISDYGEVGVIDTEWC